MEYQVLNITNDLRSEAKGKKQKMSILWSHDRPVACGTQATVFENELLVIS